MTGRHPEERGSMAVEVVFLAPVLLMFAMLVVAGGRYVDTQGDVEAAARDAARAASLQDDYADAVRAADATISASLDSADCQHTIDADWRADGTFSVRVRCQVPWDDLGLIGLPGSTTVEAESHVRLDPYRSFE